MNCILTVTRSSTLCRSCFLVVTLRCNHYKTLKISQDASIQEIKSAYFALSKKCHPDTIKSNKEKTQEFIKINEAYSVLSCKKTRQNYDQYLSTIGRSSFTRGERQQDGFGHEGFRNRSRFHHQQSYSGYHNDTDFGQTKFSNEKLSKKLVRRLMIRSALITTLLIFALYCDVFARQFRKIAEQNNIHQRSHALPETRLQTIDHERDQGN